MARSSLIYGATMKMMKSRLRGLIVLTKKQNPPGAAVAQLQVHDLAGDCQLLPLTEAPHCRARAITVREPRCGCPALRVPCSTLRRRIVASMDAK
jgi:hypothetical protein